MRPRETETDTKGDRKYHPRSYLEEIKGKYDQKGGNIAKWIRKTSEK